MGAIKDLVDLVTQLNNSVEDRKFAGELREIQRMIGNIQSDHAAIHEQRIQLMIENAELKQVIASLKEEVAALKQQKEHSKHQHESSGQSISKEEEQILLLLAKTEEATAHQIAYQLQYDLTKTEYWLEHLRDNDMIYFSFVMNQPTAYYLEQGGRKYLVENGLI
jgi:septal ring factor EnvC (AmiA/AmiB activator)